jgi:hypothetical protein
MGIPKVAITSSIVLISWGRECVMAKNRKAKTAARKGKPKKKGILDRMVEAVSPTRRNARGGNITRRQGV